MNDNFKSGFAALVGRPNVGKSTLFNALAGGMISIVKDTPEAPDHQKPHSDRVHE